MEKRQLEDIFGGLEQAGVRFLVAGGIAVIAYGFTRVTQEIALILDMDGSNIDKAVDVFTGLGFRPSIPVSLEDFKNPTKRKEWIENKGMIVLSLWGEPKYKSKVDIMLAVAFDFDEEYGKGVTVDLGEAKNIHVISFDTLIWMKSGTGREKDLADIRQLKRIKELNENGI